MCAIYLGNYKEPEICLAGGYIFRRYFNFNTDQVFY